MFGDKAKGGFNFGSTTSGGTTGSGFTFGTSSTPAAATQAPTAGFSFAAPQAPSAAPSNQGGFAFSATSAPAPAVTASTGFSFAAKPAGEATLGTAPQASGFTFSGTPATTGGLSFGAAPSSAPSGTTQGFGAASSAATSAQTTQLFGAAAPSGATQGFGLSGSKHGASTASSTGFAFAGTTTAPSSTGFSLGGAKTTLGGTTSSTPLLANLVAGTAKTTSSALPAFGATTQAAGLNLGGAAKPVGFGTATQSAGGPSLGTTRPVGGLTLGATTQPSGGLTFGSTAQSTGGLKLGTTTQATGGITLGTTTQAAGGITLGTSNSFKPSGTTTAPTTGTLLGVPGTSKPATSSAATTAATSSSAGQAVTTATPQLTYKQLEEQINKWAGDLEDYERTFLDQASQVNAWDRLLMENGEKITDLNVNVESVKAEQKRLDEELDFILAQQQELEVLLKPLEDELKKRTSGPGQLQHADREREFTYGLAKDIDGQLKQMVGDLKAIIDHLNDAGSTQQENNDPIVQVAKILNAHMNSLQWIDQNAALLQRKVDEVSSLSDIQRKEQERNFRLAFD